MVNNTEKYTYYTCRSMVRTKKKQENTAEE